MKHLKFDLIAAHLRWGEDRHAAFVIKELGIVYQLATPQSIGDQWWFWNCENIPEKLPEYITDLNLTPMECIGFGLSKEDAEKIHDYVGIMNTITIYVNGRPFEVDLNKGSRIDYNYIRDLAGFTDIQYPIIEYSSNLKCMLTKFKVIELKEGDVFTVTARNHFK